MNASENDLALRLILAALHSGLLFAPTTIGEVSARMVCHYPSRSCPAPDYLFVQLPVLRLCQYLGPTQCFLLYTKSGLCLLVIDSGFFLAHVLRLHSSRSCQKSSHVASVETDGVCLNCTCVRGFREKRLSCCLKMRVGSAHTATEPDSRPTCN